jgi:hypothetical protein
MEENKKSLSYYMRSLHRDLGYLIVGLVIVYSLSGITLLYRNTSFLKQDVTVEKQLKPGLDEDQLGREIRMRDFKVEKTEGDIVYFQNGTYNKATGQAQVKSKEVIFPFNKFIDFHTTISLKLNHWGGLFFQHHFFVSGYFFVLDV